MCVSERIKVTNQSPLRWPRYTLDSILRALTNRSPDLLHGSILMFLRLTIHSTRKRFLPTSFDSRQTSVLYCQESCQKTYLMRSSAPIQHRSNIANTAISTVDRSLNSHSLYMPSAFTHEILQATRSHLIVAISQTDSQCGLISSSQISQTATAKQNLSLKSSRSLTSHAKTQKPS